MEYRFDSYCGLYCGACDVLQANIENRHGKMASSLGNTEENFICHGCKTKQVSEWCGKCKIRLCAINKNIEYCFECSNFPCEDWAVFSKDKRFIQFHKKALPNMKYIKGNGITSWLEQQDKEWRCISCDHIIAWKDSNCRRCGTEINSKQN